MYLENEDIFCCEGCGRSDLDNGFCPLCCPSAGEYQPGSEECDFCMYSDECGKFD